MYGVVGGLNTANSNTSAKTMPVPTSATFRAARMIRDLSPLRGFGAVLVFLDDARFAMENSYTAPAAHCERGSRSEIAFAR
jgi:hypothetical protein